MSDVFSIMWENEKRSVALQTKTWEQRDKAWQFIRDLANEDIDGEAQMKARGFLTEIGQTGEIRPSKRLK